MRITGRGVRARSGALTAGCSELTKVENQGIVEPTSVANPIGAIARHAGATRTFVADVISAINTTALFSDEWQLGDFPGNSLNTNLDARRPASAAYQTGSIFSTHTGALTT